MASEEDAYALEVLVDRLGLRGVLGILAEVCQGKADHLRSNWQDDDRGKALGKLSTRQS